MNKRNIILFSGIFLVVALIAFGTYSYWIWRSTTNKNIVFTTAGISDYIEYDEGNSHFVGNFQAYATFCESVNTTVSIKKKPVAEAVDLRATIYMDINSIGDNIAASNDVYWVITEGDSTVTCTDGLTSGSVINSGTFNGVAAGDVITLATNLEVTLVEKKYTVWIWVDSNGDSLSSLAGETVDTNVWTQVDMGDANSSSDSGTTNDTESPTCTLNASGTTITATISNTNDLIYYGWDSSYSGDNSTTTTISGAGTYSYYMLDSAGKTGVCRGTVEDMIETTTQVCNYSEDGGGCYYNSTSALVVGGSCRCRGQSTSTGGYPIMEGTCVASGCSCSSGYTVYSNSCTKSCSSGFLSTSGTYCKVYTSYSTTTTYSCSEGSTMLNDSYCWVTS